MRQSIITQTTPWCIADSAPGTLCTKHSSSIGARRRS